MEIKVGQVWKCGDTEYLIIEIYKDMVHLRDLSKDGSYSFCTKGGFKGLYSFQRENKSFYNRVICKNEYTAIAFIIAVCAMVALLIKILS